MKKIETTLERIRRFVKIYSPNNLPSQRSEILQEKQDAFWLSHMRMAKQGKGKHKWNKKLDQIANEHGFYNLFDIKQQHTDALTRIKQFSKKYTLETLPKASSKNRKEVQDYRWLMAMRQAKRKGSQYNGYCWHEDLQKIADEAGLVGIFKSKSKNQIIKENNERNKQTLYKFIKLYSPDNLPGPSDKYYKWWKNLIRNKKRYVKSWNKDLDKISQQHGFIGLFDYVSRKNKAIKTLIRIMNTYSVNKLPSKYSNNHQERKDSGWIQDKRNAKYNRSHNSSVWYPELEKIAKQYGFIGLFDRKRK